MGEVWSFEALVQAAADAVAALATVAWLELHTGRVARAEIVEVGPLAARSTAS